MPFRFPFLLLLIVLIPVLVIRSAEGSSPVWLKEGAYAKYELDSNQATFRWACAKVEGNTAELNVTYTSSGGAQTTRHSALVHVDTETRDVTLLNGTSVGKTLLWLPANPTQGKTIALSDKLTATVRIPGGWMLTPQGYQKMFMAENWTVDFSAEYDLDTGVLISLFSWSEEATLRALNMTLGPGSTKFVETNIDLGPREWWPEIGRALPILLPVVAFALIFIFLLYRLMKRRRRMIRRVKLKKPV